MILVSFLDLGLQNVPLVEEREPKKGLFRSNSVTVYQTRASRERHTAKPITAYWLKILQKDQFQFPAGFFDDDRVALIHQWFTWCKQGGTKMTSSPSRRRLKSVVDINFDELVFSLFSTEIEEAFKESETNDISTEVQAEKLEKSELVEMMENEDISYHSDESLEVQLILSRRLHDEEVSKEGPQISDEDLQKVLASKTPPKPRPRTIFLTEVEIQEDRKVEEEPEVSFLLVT
jgi:hypothetical protein